MSELVDQCVRGWAAKPPRGSERLAHTIASDAARTMVRARDGRHWPTVAKGLKALDNEGWSRLVSGKTTFLLDDRLVVLPAGFLSVLEDVGVGALELLFNDRVMLVELGQYHGLLGLVRRPSP